MRKYIALLISILIFFTGFNCKRDFLNPYDRECPPEIWTPYNLFIENNQGEVVLKWEQNADHFDGFKLERSTDSLNWESLSDDYISLTQHEYSDSVHWPGKTLIYRIFAVADKNYSDTCYFSSIVFPVESPNVVTEKVISFGLGSAILSGKVLSDGGSTVTERGFCYSVHEYPDKRDTIVVLGSEIGDFTTTISGLLPCYTYHVRAFATNSVGTNYGEQMSLTIVCDNIITDGLVAHYPFNGSAVDVSGNENHGVNRGAILTDDRFNVPYSAYYFDGARAFIKVMPSLSIKDIETKNALSVSAWIKITGWYQNWNCFNIINKYDTISDYGWEFQVNRKPQGLTLVAKNNVYSIADWIPKFGQWYFVAATYDMELGAASFYVDGNLSVKNKFASSLFATEGPLYIGYSPAGPDEFSYGTLDDIRIYNRALTESEVQRLYNE